jgi:hypothetical protein
VSKLRCVRCGQPILPGQSHITTDDGQAKHVACPTIRQIWRARLWGRWT